MAKKKRKKRKKGEYGAEDIYVLEGLDPVRKRPGMYIGSTGTQGLHHLIWEVLDNGIDEAIGGYADEITIKLLSNNRVECSDNGRGIPVGKHKQTKKSSLETVMTTLHAGAKFGSKAYQVAGGLHGVGVSVVCALSKYLKAEVCRDGKKYVQEYSRGETKSKLKKAGNCRKTGTTVTFEPDPEIFNNLKFNLKKIKDHLRQQAYLTKGVQINLIDAREKGKVKPYCFYFEGGIASYVKYINKEGKPIHDSIFYCSDKNDNIIVEAAMQYTDEYEGFLEGFANNIHTEGGGSHLTGFKTALTRTINKYAKDNGFLKEDDSNISGRDIREGMNVVVSVKIPEPQFEGQTKAKLGNPEAKSAVESVVSKHLMDFLERNPRDAKEIINKGLVAAKARKAAKLARKTVIKKQGLKGLSLPGKLADCSSRKPEESELYIVEGDSAGGSAKQGRDRRFQAILPLKGKILNVEKARLDRILNSKEVKSLVIALGTAIAEDFNIDKARYHRIIIMTDADVDGAHIRTLLLTLFYRYFKPLIENNYLYIAQPPLYRLKAGKTMKYVYTEKEKQKELKKIKKKYKNIDIQRFKGLGEMNPNQLWKTTMDPKNRVLLKVNIEDAAEADKVFDTLMGSEVLPRKKFIQTHAKEVSNLDI